MNGREPVDRWKIETNDRYAKIVSSIISLATGALVLPILFLRDFLGIPKERALTPYLTRAPIIAWSCLGSCILVGLAYSWLSVKSVKRAWGQETWLSEHCLERAMDGLFVLMGVLFVLGLIASVWFFATVRITS